MFAVVSPAHRHIALSPDDLTMEVVFASREAVQTSNWSSSQMKLPRWNLLIIVSYIDRYIPKTKSSKEAIKICDKLIVIESGCDPENFCRL